MIARSPFQCRHLVSVAWRAPSTCRTDSYGLASGGRRDGAGTAPFDEQIEGWQDEQGQERCGNEPADDDDGEGLLRFGTDAMRKRHGQEAEHGEQRRHEDSAQTHLRTVQDRFHGRFAIIEAFVEMADHDHAIQHGLAKEGNEPNRSRNAERDAGEEQSENSADQAERHIHKDEQRALHRLKGIKQQHENEEHTDGYNQSEAFHRALLVLELAAPGHVITRRKLHVALDDRLHVLDNAAHVATLDENRNGEDAFAVLAADVHAAAHALEAGDLRQRDILAAGRVDQNVSEIIERTFFLAQADDHSELLFAFPDLRGRATAQSRFDDFLNIEHVQVVTRGAVAIDGDDRLRQLAQPIHKRARDPRNFLHVAQDLFGVRPQDGKVIAKNFDDNLSVDLRDALEDIVADGLREARLDARQGADRAVHLVHQLVFGDFAGPLLDGLKADEKLRHVDELGIGAVFGAAGFGDDRLDLGDGAQGIADAGALAGGFAHGDAGRKHDIDPGRAFIQFRKEFRAESRDGRQACN